jgi:hypothetical protein
MRSTADRRPMVENPFLAPEAAAPPARRQTTGQRSQSVRRDSVDFAVRYSLARFARGIPLTGNVLAATSGSGRARTVAHYLARSLGGTERTRATQLEWIVFGRQFRSGPKRGWKVGKSKRGRGTRWMVVVDGQGVPLGKQLYSASPICVSRRHHAWRPRQKRSSRRSRL